MEGVPCAGMQVRHGSQPVAALRPKVPATTAGRSNRGAVRPLKVAQLEEPSTSARDADNLADAMDARPLPQRRGAGPGPLQPGTATVALLMAASQAVWIAVLKTSGCPSHGR